MVYLLVSLSPTVAKIGKSDCGSEQRKRPMSDGERDYQVGPGKPPLHTRFRKGQSGNPRGSNVS
jgi:hypothetical protein